MSIDRCVTVVHSPLADALTRSERRLVDLLEFYRPLGEPHLSTRRFDDLGVVLAVIDFNGGAEDMADRLLFGAELPRGLDSAERLLAANPHQLRDLDGPLAVVAVGPGRLRILTGAGPPTMLYESASAETQVWSSHAVPAAYLASGKVVVDSDAIAEFLATQFVGDSRTLIRDTFAVDAAAEITLDSDGVRRTSYWPARDRWQLIDPADASAHAEKALLESLPRRLRGLTRPFLGLTGGLDSRVTAVALSELGLDVEACTFGETDWPDVTAAEVVARALTLPHRYCPFEWIGDREAISRARAAARWHEGAIQLGIGRVRMPKEMQAFVTGGGGETGRAFYYRRYAYRQSRAEPEGARRALIDALERRIAGASDAALASVRRSAERWIADAEALGAEGWRTLDVLYAEQRVRRWGRGTISREVGTSIPVFAIPEVQRALASMPLSDRLEDGFHRGFLRRHAPMLLPPPAPVPQRPTSLGRIRRRVVRMFPFARRSTPALHASRWDQYPDFRGWIADDILRSDLLAAGLGDRWLSRTRASFLDGDGSAEATALWAAGPVTLAAELRDLGTSASRPAGQRTQPLG